MPHNKALPTLRSLTIQVESFLVLVLDPFYTFVGANSFSARRLSQHLNMLRSSTLKCPPLSSPAALQHAKGPCRGTGGGCIASGSLSRGLPNGIEGSCPFRHLSFAEDRPPCRIANFCEAFLSQSEAPKRQSSFQKPAVLHMWLGPQTVHYRKRPVHFVYTASRRGQNSFGFKGLGFRVEGYKGLRFKALRCK